jgi:hypothetical protein
VLDQLEKFEPIVSGKNIQIERIFSLDSRIKLWYCVLENQMCYEYISFNQERTAEITCE